MATFGLVSNATMTGKDYRKRGSTENGKKITMYSLAEDGRDPV